jgi:hypothetical protein
MQPSIRHRSWAAVGLAGAVALPALSLAATPASAEPTPCRLVELRQPDGAYDGGVMDIEVVDGRTVYYGNTHERDRRGVDHQRAVVWRGLAGPPVRVGPSGFDEDIAFELTETGLVNGQSLDWETGREVAWVQDIGTMQLTLLDTGTGHGPMWMRRINDRAEVAGMVGRNPDEPWTDAVGFDSPTSPMELLPGSAEAADAVASGINNHGQRTGYLATRPMGDSGWYWFDPVVWEEDGTVTQLAVAGALDGAPRAIKDDGSVSGSVLYGDAVGEAHVEPAYWPTPATLVTLGVLPGGDFGDVYGMDEGGWLVGQYARAVKRNDRLGERGVMGHAFLWTPSIGEGRVRLLPSLYATAKRDADWRHWHGTAVHAVNGRLNQVASGSHVEFRHGRPITAPTVWLNADRCGREVLTTHDPFGLHAPSESALRAPAPRRGMHVSDRAVQAWKRADAR